MAQVKAQEKAAGPDSNLMGALAYLPVAQPLIPIGILLVKQDDSFAKFHSIQSIALAVVYIIASFVIFLLGTVLMFATLGFGAILFVPLIFLFVLAALGVDIFMMYKAYKGEKYKLPVIGNWAEKFK